MANFTQGDPRPTIALAPYQGNGSLVLDSRRTRPLWFDGRFLAATSLEREQNYFLQRQADLGRAPGFGVLRGLLVSVVTLDGQSTDIVRIAAGSGITPAGEQVTVPSGVTIHLASLTQQPNLDLQLAVASEPSPAPSTRTGLFALALQPVQFTANPITQYPTTIQGSRTMHDGDLVEATSITLVPYPNPINTSNWTTLQAALARQIFLTGNPSQLLDSLLPLALVFLQNGVIQWLDTYMLRRESGIGFSGVRFGLTDPATQQAYLQQYDSQLQQAVNTFLRQNLPANFPATNYFQSLPPAGRFPLASINTDSFTQNFFPPQMDVRLSIVPQDEIAALLEESNSLPPIDLTLDPSAYANLTVFAMIPVPRSGFSALANSLPEVPITGVLPQVLGNRLPIDLLRFYQGANGIVSPPPAANNQWQAALAGQTYGIYTRRPSSASATTFTVPPPPTTTTTTTTTTTSPPTTTTTTTTAPPATTTTTTTTKPPTTTTTTTTTKPPTTTTTTTTTKPPTTTTTTTTTTARTTIKPPVTGTLIPVTLIPVTIPPLTVPPVTLNPLERNAVDATLAQTPTEPKTPTS